MASFIVKGKVISGIVNGNSFTVNESHPNYAKIKVALNEKDDNLVVELLSFKKVVDKVVNTLCAGRVVELRNNEVLFRGKPIHNAISRRILELAREEFDFHPLVKFLENLMKNPSAKAIEELFDFLDRKNLPISEDGCFYGYKAIQSDWYSKTAGKTELIKGTVREDGRIFNGIGEEIECERNQVDDDRDNECSYGLHVGALEYSGPNGWFNSCDNRCIIVKVNPKDVIAVPKDHNATKVRVCAYTVISEYKGALNKAVYTNDEELVTQPEEEVDSVTFRNNVDADEIEYGDVIHFDYEGKRRYLSVEDASDEHVAGVLIEPEQHFGEYRRFSVYKMSNISLDLET